MTTTSWGEMFLVLFGLSGIIANGRLLQLMRRKKAAAIKNGARSDGPRILAADRYIRNDIARIMVCAIGVSYGLVGAWLPESLPSFHWFIRSIDYVLAFALFVTMVTGLLDLKDDSRLTRMLQAEEV